MKKLLFSIFFLCTVNLIQSQINFEKGYFIANNDDKVECLIKNEDWRSNPQLIQYKLNENDEVKSATISNIKEFHIYDSSKFIRANVDIELSSLRTDKLTETRKLTFENKTLYLRVLSEGKANLYSYRDNDVVKYFYSIDGSKIEQLIYHRFLSSSIDKTIIENGQFRYTLNQNLNCGNNSANKLEYNIKDLTSFFNDYNICSGGDSTSIYKEKERKAKMNFYVKVGTEFSQINIATTQTLNAEFNSTTITYGLELEYILPFVQNKWGLFISPMYRNIEVEGVRISQSSVANNVAALLKYKSVELGLGVKHFFYINDSSSFFVEGAFNFNFTIGELQNSLVYTYEQTEVSQGGTFPSSLQLDPFQTTKSFGAGYKYRNVYAKVNYTTSNGLYSRIGKPTDYAKLAITLGCMF